MPSLQSRVVNFLLRNRHFFSGRFTKETYDKNTSIQAFRDLCEKGAKRYAKIPADISVQPGLIGNIKMEWLIPEGSAEDKVIMYVHGGGYVSGSCSDHRGFVSKFASKAGFRTLTYEYRLAPEHPFPAAVDDSVMVYRWLLDSGFMPKDILVAGESAGGGLTLALLLALKQMEVPLPAAAVAISPWTDLTCSGDSYRTKNRWSLAPLNSWYVFSDHYAGNTPKDEPLLSPLYGDLKGLPPLFINAGIDDELYDDGAAFYRKATEAGVEATFRAGPGMVHCYPLLAPMFPEATEAMNEIILFIKAKLASTGSSASTTTAL